MKNLCKALIWNACFLELSDDDTINPDSAVKSLEDMATALQSATEEEKQVFVISCQEEADRLSKEAGPEFAKTGEFIRSLPKAVGIQE